MRYFLNLKKLASSFVLLYGLIFCSYSEATVWVRAYQTENYKFKAHILALGKSNQSFSNYLLEQQKEQMESFQIKDKIVKAQSHYLSGEVKAALKMFKQITNLSLKADWNEEERRAIFYSFLRLAQNEDAKAKREAFLLSASQFIIDIVDKNYPDYNLFPPPLWKEFHNIQNNQTFLSISWKAIFPKHEKILLNGKVIIFDKDIKLPEASYRVTALSSSHAPWIKIRSLSYLATREIKTNSLTFGSCKNLHIKDFWNKRGRKLFKEACPEETHLGYAKVNPIEQRGDIELEDEQSQQESRSSSVFNNKSSNSLQTINHSLPESLQFKKENRTQWLVIGGLTVVVGFFLLQKSQNKVPSSTVNY